MRFLVDTNLPPALSGLLNSLGHDAVHTSAIGLEKAKDRDIWQHAKTEARCIVTKDEDFVLFNAADSSGPSVVWVRLGNAVRRVILQRISDIWPEVIAKLSSGETIVEVR